MICNCLLLYFFGISAYFLASTTAYEAIFGGFRVNGNSFPYQVSVQVHGYGHICGGGIIGNRFILTAAQCVLNRTRLLRSTRISILAGTNSLKKTGPPTVNILVEKVFFPKEFHPTVAFNHGDIAILRLTDSLKLEHETNLIKLNLPRDYNLPEGRTAVAGFGWNEHHIIHGKSVGVSDGHLRIAYVDTLSDDECEQRYPQGAIASDVHLCAQIRAPSRPYASSRLGLCYGDAGSPLTDIDRTKVIGILSRISPECDEQHEPGVYTRVIHYVGMILNVMERGRDPSMISLNT